MGDPAILHKVTAFVTRGAELLLFRHPEAGIQLPAGTVEEGESLEAAVCREAEEESGLLGIRLRRWLYSRREPLPPQERLLLREARLRPTMPGAEPGLLLKRGLAVRCLASQGQDTRALYETYEWEDGARTRCLVRAEGWLPTACLTAHVERHFYHLSYEGATPPRWYAESDGHRFELFWAPLQGPLGLIPPQAAWWDLVRDQFVERGG